MCIFMCRDDVNKAMSHKSNALQCSYWIIQHMLFNFDLQMNLLFFFFVFLCFSSFHLFHLTWISLDFFSAFELHSSCSKRIHTGLEWIQFHLCFRVDFKNVYMYRDVIIVNQMKIILKRIEIFYSWYFSC